MKRTRHGFCGELLALGSHAGTLVDPGSNEPDSFMFGC